MLTFKQAKEIREKYIGGDHTVVELAVEYGCNSSTIRDVVLYKSHRRPKISYGKLTITDPVDTCKDHRQEPIDWDVVQQALKYVSRGGDKDDERAFIVFLAETGRMEFWRSKLRFYRQSRAKGRYNSSGVHTVHGPGWELLQSSLASTEAAHQAGEDGSPSDPVVNAKSPNSYYKDEKDMELLLDELHRTVRLTERQRAIIEMRIDGEIQEDMAIALGVSPALIRKELRIIEGKLKQCDWVRDSVRDDPGADGG